MTVTSDKLWTYARKFADKHEQSGNGTKYPTMRQAARRFKCKVADIQDAIDDTSFKDKYLGAVVGYGNGAGTYSIESQNNYEVEAY